MSTSTKPRRVEILQGSGTGYWKKGQFGYVVSTNTKGGSHFCNRTFDNTRKNGGDGVSKKGEPAFLVSKTPDMRGGALWFSADGIRFTRGR